MAKADAMLVDTVEEVLGDFSEHNGLYRKRLSGACKAFLTTEEIVNKADIDRLAKMLRILSFSRSQKSTCSRRIKLHSISLKLFNSLERNRQLPLEE